MMTCIIVKSGGKGGVALLRHKGYDNYVVPLNIGSDRV